MTESIPKEFPGFSRYYYKNFFIFPHILEEYLGEMSGSEVKVLLFILRRTIGWRKTRDMISLSQFKDGVGGNKKGTGLSISQIRRAIEGLEYKGFITVIRRMRKPSVVELVMEKNRTVIDSKAFDIFTNINVENWQ